MAVPGEREVLQRGLDAFAELGYERTTVRELARRLGVSHNFVNDRFGSKAGFWRAVVDFGTAEAGPLVLDSDAALDDVDLITAVLTRFYGNTATLPQLHRLISDEAARDSDRLNHLVERFIAPTLAAVEAAVDRLVASGRMQPIPMHVLFFALTSAAAGLFQTPLARRLGRPDSLDEGELSRMAEVLVTCVLSGAMPSDGLPPRR